MNLLFTFSVYFGAIGVKYVWTNEAAQPFVNGLGNSTNWLCKSIVSYILPLIYEDLPLYWTPLIMSIAGVVMYIFLRPMIIETKSKSLEGIKLEYSKYKFSLCRP